MRFSLLYDIQKVDILLTHILSQCPTSIHPENIRKPEILVVNMLKRINMVFLKMIITFMNKHSQKKTKKTSIAKKKWHAQKTQKMIMVQFFLLIIY